MKPKSRWQRNREKGEFWLAWASDSNRLHSVGTNYYKMLIRYNHWKLGYGFKLICNENRVDEATQTNKRSN